jgi:hypothetical protein
MDDVYQRLQPFVKHLREQANLQKVRKVKAAKKSQDALQMSSEETVASSLPSSTAITSTPSSASKVNVPCVTAGAGAGDGAGAGAGEELAELPPLYVVSVDIKDCFDSVKHEKLFEIVAKALMEHGARFPTEINLHSRMPLDPTHVRLKQTCV